MKSADTPSPAAEENPASVATTAEDTGRSVQVDLLRGIVERLLADLKEGAGDRDKRRQVEDWMRSLSEKYPEFPIENGLRDYFLAEAQRLRGDFDKSTDLTEKLALGRTIEGLLEKAAEYRKR